MHVSAAQVKKNRKGIAKLWEIIHPVWVDLDDFIWIPRERNDRTTCTHEETVRKVSGKQGPKNECGATGCFAGWNWTYPPYQRWCRKHLMRVASTQNLSIYLGLHDHEHSFFSTSDNISGLSEYEEVQQRIKDLLVYPIYGDDQEPYYNESLNIIP